MMPKLKHLGMRFNLVNDDSVFFVLKSRIKSNFITNMNKNQKLLLSIGLIIIVASIIVWAIFGFEIFTKTQVLVETKDELFGWSEKKWVDKFIWGLDITLLISGITILLGGILMYLFRDRKKSPKKNYFERVKR